MGERLGPACGGQHMPSHILVGEARERPVLGGVRIEQPGRESEHRVDARSRLLQDDERQFRLPRCAPDGEIEQVAQPVEGTAQVMGGDRHQGVEFAVPLHQPVILQADGALLLVIAATSGMDQRCGDDGDDRDDRGMTMAMTCSAGNVAVPSTIQQ